MLSPCPFPTACCSEADAAAAVLARAQGASDAAAGDTCAISGRRCACWSCFRVLMKGFQSTTQGLPVGHDMHDRASGVCLSEQLINFDLL